MAYVPMNRAWTLVICTRPQDYMPVRVHEAASYLSGRSDATEEEWRLATEAIDIVASCQRIGGDLLNIHLKTR